MIGDNEKHRKSSKYNLEILLGFLVSLFLIGSCLQSDSKSDNSKQASESTTEVEPPKIYKYGFDVSANHFEKVPIKKNQFIANILSDHGIGFDLIHTLEQKARDVFSVTKLRAGKDLVLVKSDECENAHCVIYEPNKFSYVKYDLTDSVNVEIIEKEVVTKIKTTSGIVESSLWNALENDIFRDLLVDKMEDALSWSVNFYAVQAGDQFKLIYEEKYIDDEPAGIGRVFGAYYENEKPHYAVYYENEGYKGFYDLEGRPTKKGFLKTPVKASRISSRFNKNRFHPILKRRKAHLGTDYAAAYGTPIRAVGNGVIEIASYTRGNGKYVKMRHDNIYQTQYLHMSRFAKGIKRGVKVSQGQTIGYVGSTGLATGPHVCFRFWKNGRQIDHLRENFPPPDPMKEEELPKFNIVKEEIQFELDRIKIDGGDALTSINADAGKENQNAALLVQNLK